MLKLRLIVVLLSNFLFVFPALANSCSAQGGCTCHWPAPAEEWTVLLQQLCFSNVHENDCVGNVLWKCTRTDLGEDAIPNFYSEPCSLNESGCETAFPPVNPNKNTCVPVSGSCYFATQDTPCAGTCFFRHLGEPISLDTIISTECECG